MQLQQPVDSSIVFSVLIIIQSFRSEDKKKKREVGGEMNCHEGGPRFEDQKLTLFPREVASCVHSLPPK